MKQARAKIQSILKWFLKAFTAFPVHYALGFFLAVFVSGQVYRMGFVSSLSSLNAFRFPAQIGVGQRNVGIHLGKHSANSIRNRHLPPVFGATKKHVKRVENQKSDQPFDVKINGKALDVKKEVNGTNLEKRISFGQRVSTVNRDEVGESKDAVEGVHVKIKINEASLKDLVKLPGVGPVLAQRILDHIHTQGIIKNVYDLVQIKGIGKIKLEKIWPLIVVP